MSNCKQCSKEIDSSFCPYCGTSAVLPRIDRHYLIHEVQHEFVHVDKGFFFTVKEMLLRPGHSIRTYMTEFRNKHFKPIAFLFISSVIYTFLDHKLGSIVVTGVIEGNVGKMMHWISENYSYANLIEILFIGLFVYLFFRKKGYNYFENIVLLCYISGFVMLMGCVFIIAGYLFKAPLIFSFYPWVALIYMVWSIGQFYDYKNPVSYLKALLAYVIGFISFLILAMVIAVGFQLAGVKF